MIGEKDVPKVIAQGVMAQNRTFACFVPMQLRNGTSIDGAKFTVGTRKGAFNGMPESRRMWLKIHNGGTVREIDLGLVGRVENTPTAMVKIRQQPWYR